MGYYLEAPSNFGKAQYLIDGEGATIFSGSTWEEVPEGRVPVCVVANPLFEAAGITYDEREFLAFRETADDPRPRTWLTIDRARAGELCRDYGDFLRRV